MRSLRIGSIILVFALWFGPYLPSAVGAASGSETAPSTPQRSNASIDILPSSFVPTLDGQCNLDEYSDASTETFLANGLDGAAQVTVRIKHTDADLYVCMSNLARPQVADGLNAVVYFNRLGTGAQAPYADDFALAVSYNGNTRLERGRSDGMYFNTNGYPSNWQAMRTIQAEPPAWSAEFRIGLDGFLGGWGHNINIAFMEQNVMAAGNNFGWPDGALTAAPSTWGGGSLVTDPSAVLLDMQPTVIEVTQAIQDTANRVLLVAGKVTFARVYVGTNFPRTAVRARLYGLRGGVSLGPPLIPSNPGGVLNVPYPSSINDARNNLNDSFLFLLPPSWTAAGTITLRADINPLHGIAETNYANNSLSSSPLTFIATPPLKLRLQAISYNANGMNFTPPTLDQDMLVSQIRRELPISALNLTRGTIFDGDPHSPLHTDPGTAGLFVVGLVDRNRDRTGADPGWIHFGQVYAGPANDRFMRGITPAVPAWTTVSPTGFNPGYLGDFDPSYGDTYGVHELAHALGRPHAGRQFTPSFNCGADFWFFNEDFPYDGIIGGPRGDLNRFVGFDLGDSSLGLGMRSVPSSFADTTTYCDNEWISDFTYRRIHDYIMTAFPLALDPQSSAPNNLLPGDFVMVQGVIDAFAHTASLLHTERMPEAGLVSPTGTGRFALRFLDAAGAEIKRVLFDAPSASDEHSSYFSLVVNLPPGTQKISVFDTQIAADLASRSFSANAPLVKSVSVSGDTTSGNSPLTVNWSASDADGDPLSFDLEYSNDGAGFRILATDLPTATFTITGGMLAGTNGATLGIFRVVANDGFLTGRKDSAAFVEGDKPPELKVSVQGYPGPVCCWGYGQNVLLAADALDLQDGVLDGKSLSWFSSLDGALGTGSQISTQFLSPGDHTITVSTLNSAGQKAEASLKLTILADADLSIPTKSEFQAAPQILTFTEVWPHWQDLTQRISLRDAAGLAIKWNLNSVPSWIKLSAEAGAAPQMVDVTVDPSGLTPGRLLTAPLTFTPEAGKGDPRTVMVSLQITGGGPTMLALPILMK